MKTEMTEREKCIYWGPKGEYGPFREQQEGPWAGWPDFGQVLRHFREKAKMSQTEFAEIYGKNFNKDKRPLSRMQVNRMELQNQVPEDRSKRVFLANLLNIPPILLGMATLETITLQPTTALIAPSILTKVIVDVAKYQTTINTLTSLQYTGSVQQMFQIQTDIQELENLGTRVRGDLLYKIQELSFTYYLLATKVTRDQRRFDLSYHHANQMVRVAKATQDTDLIATAHYIRGRTSLTWGRAGVLNEQGVYQIQVDKINKALNDFAKARAIKNLHPQLIGLIDIYISWANANLLGEKASNLVIPLLDNIYEENVDRESIGDSHTRMLVTGSRIGLIEGEYLNMRATILNTIKAPVKALEVLKIMKNLQAGKIGKEYTSHQAWIQTVEANTLLGLGNYSKAVKLIRLALETYKDINNVDGLADLVDIHGRLLQSPYKNQSDLEELGEQLRTSIPQKTSQI